MRCVPEAPRVRARLAVLAGRPWAMGGAPAGGPRRSSRPKGGDLGASRPSATIATMTRCLVAVVALLLCAASDALQVGALTARGAACRAPAARAQLMEGPKSGPSNVQEAVQDSQDLEIYDPKTDPLGESEFVKWYRYEKAIADWEKENPKDVIGDAFERLKGPVSSLAVLAGGFYAIPLVRGISEGIQSGDFFETVSSSLEQPTQALDGISLPF